MNETEARSVSGAATSSRKGRLRVYLGYAAGVGKSYQMLHDAQELAKGGAEVVVGYFEPHARKDTIEKSEGLEFVPRRVVHYRDARFEEMDTDAILARHPRICLVDELAHTNVPGSEREKRWQDVRALLEAGIDVYSTLNVQHLESLNDPIYRMTGVRVRETVPDWVLREADEVTLVDVTPRALRNRLERGVVYAPEKARQAMENFFTEANLTALREFALRQAAREVEDQLEAASPLSGADALQEEKILVCLSSRDTSVALIRRGKRVADFFHADCIAAYVIPRPDWKGVPAQERAAVERHLKLAEELRLKTELWVGRDIARTLVEHARETGVTRLFIGRSRESRWRLFLRGDLIDRVLRLAPDLQITVVSP
jgi:two-component system sensor histidine kinase KdpD